MKKTFKYRLLGNKITFDNADEWLLLCRRLYNVALEQRICAYKQNKKTISYYTQSKQLPELKETFPEYRAVGAQVLQDVLDRLDKAYKSFFRRAKNGEGKTGFPRFKGEGRYNSFTLKQTGWELDGRYLTINNIGRFKLRLSRPIEGNIKTVIIRKSPTKQWYVCFSCDNVPEKILPESDKIIGLDVGIKSFLTDSKDNKVENPKFLKHKIKELRVKQRKLSRAKKGLNRRKKAKLRVAKCHEKITNQRRDFHHKLANQYITDYGIIVVEKLEIGNMIKNHKLTRDISDCAWGDFFEILSYKAEEAGREIIQINPKNTSKTCSECGAINQELKLSDRNWLCKSCGTYHDRDFNAAKNIKRVGQTQQELTYGSSQSVS
jgi:putative transposase